MRTYEGDTIGNIWLRLLEDLYNLGSPVSPRGKKCYEFLDVTLRLNDARNNVFVHSARGLSYRFMVAEWLWIAYGRDDVATIEKYNPYIAQFSDDGITFNGAYGRPVKAQWNIVLENLAGDPYTRQAVIDIFGGLRSRTSKDVPCTLSIQFFERFEKLEMTVTMRSSDVWLGLPYDVFTFTMLANKMAEQLGIELGGLTLHLGSSHLYEVDRVKAHEVLSMPRVETVRSPVIDARLPDWLERVLVAKGPAMFNGVCAWDPSLPASGSVFDTYARVLTSRNNAEALDLLRGFNGSS
jgi:thymidylate synthase